MSSMVDDLLDWVFGELLALYIAATIFFSW